VDDRQPDSQLNFVSFATLLDAEERFLAEKYTLQYLLSGRDVLRDVQPGIRTAAFVFANPDFTLNSSHIVVGADRNSSIAIGALRGTEKRGIEDLTFGPLEGTQKECDRLVNAFEGWHWSAEVFTGPNATKAALLQVHAPYPALGHARILRVGRPTRNRIRGATARWLGTERDQIKVL
jgi:hypothetical protein